MALLLGRLVGAGEAVLSPETHAFRADFAKVSDGMYRDDVVRLLGPPDYESSEFHLGQFEGFEAVYAEAVASAANSFLFWERGIDTVYAIGLTADGRVVFTASGGT